MSDKAFEIVRLDEFEYDGAHVKLSRYGDKFCVTKWMVGAETQVFQTPNVSTADAKFEEFKRDVHVAKAMEALHGKEK